MLPEIQVLMTELEDRKSELLEDLKSYSEDQMQFQPAPDRWSMLMAMKAYDFLVVGLGTVGSTTCMELARRGFSVLGIDARHPPHNFCRGVGSRGRTALSGIVY